MKTFVSLAPKCQIPNLCISSLDNNRKSFELVNMTKIRRYDKKTSLDSIILMSPKLKTQIKKNVRASTFIYRCCDFTL